MKLDVVVPTYNRSSLLRRTILSLLKARVPVGLDVTVRIVDNNSKDDTEQVVREYESRPELQIIYMKEANQGLSHSRNGGLRAGDGEIVGFIDDDEEIDENWFGVIAREFSDPKTQFIGGPCLANWAAPPPSWLPRGYHAVIGVMEQKPRAQFGPSFSGMLVGGNAVLRRSVFDLVGPYSIKLGRSGKGLLSDEDAEFFRRLTAANLLGMYVPDLIIYHHVPEDRLTRRYHRRWCYWRGVSQGYADRELREPVPYTLGIPRYRIGRALKGLALLPWHLFARNGGAQAFTDELASWDLAGFVHGRHFVRMERYYGKE